jgi:hypothetical protein
VPALITVVAPRTTDAFHVQVPVTASIGNSNWAP